MTTIQDIVKKCGSLDAAIDAYLDRELNEEEDLCFTWNCHFYAAVLRRIFERLPGKSYGRTDAKGDRQR